MHYMVMTVDGRTAAFKQIVGTVDSDVKS